MRGLLVLAALTALMVHPVRAAENAAVETLPESSPAVEEEIIAVPSLDDEIVGLDPSVEASAEIYAAEKQKLPACADSRLKELVLAKVHEYHSEHPVSSILEKRRQALLYKNVQQFAEVSAEGFTSKQDFNVANKLLMVKINNGLDNQELRLCKNEGAGKAGEIYLLIYPYGFDIRVSILNFVPQVSGQDEFYINYPQNDEA
ncbi:MAG: hypothetical protein OSJ76_07860 [Alphaproteobacteria bacterium]|nr:hypothetical protein [Alphaproteobacteria bacterium]